MKKITLITSLFLFNIIVFFSATAKTIEVSSQAEFNKAHSSAAAKDIILWLPGTFSDIDMNITKSNLTIKAKILGKTTFSGSSKVSIRGNNVTFKGFQYINGDIGSNVVIKVSGSHNHLTELNVSRYISNKYFIISDLSQYTRVSHCNFENRINSADKSILSISVSESQPGFHTIQYCSFKKFKGIGRNMEVEPITIGASSQGGFDSKTIVEYCYFVQCNGGGEIINKSSKNVFRYNTFEDNPNGELVLRHGSGIYIYGNFFLNGKGGIRIREGANHFIFNNYFSGLKERSIILKGVEANPVKNIYIMHNTFVKTAKIELGGQNRVLPKKVIIANNLFALPDGNIIKDISGKEQWIGNMYKGNLGTSAREGLENVDSLLSKNHYGFYEIDNNNPVVNSAQKRATKLPVYKDLDVDNMLSYDILKNKRPTLYSEKDVGCQEFKSGTVLKPMATSKNTGPSYNTGQTIKRITTSVHKK